MPRALCGMRPVSPRVRALEWSVHVKMFTGLACPVCRGELFFGAVASICLDTLKMPPKGSWLPSVSLGALLTTIRLLLSLPNPDDGLMPDIVRRRHCV